MTAGDRRRIGALVASLAGPFTVIAALSGRIAGHVGLSQTGLLIGDAIVAAMLFLILVMSGRRNRTF